MYPRPSFRPLCVVATFIIFLFVLAPCPIAAQVCTNDQQGPDDEPGQKDLNQFCTAVVGACVGGSNYSWKFDDTNWTGNNTGDACALFDTDNPPDGNANRAVCVTIVDGGQMQTGNPKCYTCANNAPDKCNSSVLVACSASTSCSVS